MKTRTFIGSLIALFLIGLAVFLLFALPEEERRQDTVAVNDVLRTVREDWDSLAEHRNPTSLDYVVLDADGAVLYRTREGLSESMNEAIGHKDTILSVEAAGKTVGRLLVYNGDGEHFRAEKRTVIAAGIGILLFQGCLCGGYFFCLRRTVLGPFEKMKRFAERIAGGDLDIPLEMDRGNLFGAFTESFDLMRAELRKARLAEARASAGKRELVAKLSHDMKTPVASIKAAAEVGEALSQDEKNRENYARIVRKADQISTLLTNLFSAALEELQELSVTPSDMKSGELRTLLANADYLRRAEIPAVPDCLLYADRLRLQQVFDNLFANSYKYADTEIKCAVWLAEGCLAVSIEDRGGGADASELPFLKEKFRRGSNTGGIEGAGLGLYISDYCMKKMGGRLDIENGSAGLKVTVRIAFSGTI